MAGAIAGKLLVLLRLRVNSLAHPTRPLNTHLGTACLQ
jgi:hypothetical protein